VFGNPLRVVNQGAKDGAAGGAAAADSCGGWGSGGGGDGLVMKMSEAQRLFGKEVLVSGIGWGEGWQPRRAVQVVSRKAATSWGPNPGRRYKAGGLGNALTDASGVSGNSDAEVPAVRQRPTRWDPHTIRAMCPRRAVGDDASYRVRDQSQLRSYNYCWTNGRSCDLEPESPAEQLCFKALLELDGKKQSMVPLGIRYKGSEVALSKFVVQPAASGLLAPRRAVLDSRSASDFVDPTRAFSYGL